MKGFIQVYFFDEEDEDMVQEAILNVSCIKGVFREGMNGCTLWLDNAIPDGTIEDHRLYVDETFEVIVERIKRATE